MYNKKILTVEEMRKLGLLSLVVGTVSSAVSLITVISMRKKLQRLEEAYAEKCKSCEELCDQEKEDSEVLFEVTVEAGDTSDDVEEKLPCEMDDETEVCEVE